MKRLTLRVAQFFLMCRFSQFWPPDRNQQDRRATSSPSLGEGDTRTVSTRRKVWPLNGAVSALDFWLSDMHGGSWELACSSRTSRQSRFKSGAKLAGCVMRGPGPGCWQALRAQRELSRTSEQVTDILRRELVKCAAQGAHLCRATPLGESFQASRRLTRRVRKTGHVDRRARAEELAVTLTAPFSVTQ